MEKIQVSLIYLWNLAQFLYAFNMNKAFLYCKDYYRDFNSCYSKIFNENNTDVKNDDTFENNDHNDHNDNNNQNDNNTYEENDEVFIQTNMQTIYSKINILLNKEKSL